MSLSFVPQFFVCQLQIVQSPIGNLRKNLGNKILLFCLYFMILGTHLVTVRVKKKDTICAKKWKYFTVSAYNFLFYPLSVNCYLHVWSLTVTIPLCFSMIHNPLTALADCKLWNHNKESRKLKRETENQNIYIYS